MVISGSVNTLKDSWLMSCAVRCSVRRALLALVWAPVGSQLTCGTIGGRYTLPQSQT